MPSIAPWLSLVLVACGGGGAATSTSSPATTPEAPTGTSADGSGPDVRVRIADEAPIDAVDPAITAAMEQAVRDAFTTPEQAQTIRAEAVLHDLSTDAAGQLRGRVRVTLVRIADERICTVLEGGAMAAAAAESSQLRVIEASLRAALRDFDRHMSECLAGSVTP